MNASQAEKWPTYGRIWSIFILYALLTLAMTWPVVGQLGTHIPGTLGDAYVHLWTFTWVKDHLFQLSSLDSFYTNQIFYPTGVSLLNHNIAWINFAIWLPLQAVVGPEVGYSIAFLLIFPLNGLATYLFAKELGLAETAAFLGGLVTAFWPYNLSHHGHPNLILIAWVPLSLIFLRRLQQKRRWQDALWAGLFIALIGLTRWQLLLMALPLLGLYWLHLLLEKRTNLVPMLKLSLLAGVTSLLLAAPLLFPVLTYQLNREDPEELLVDEIPYQTDLAAYVTPGSYHPVWGEWFMQLTRGYVGNNLYVRFVGFSALLLAILGAVGQFRQARLWLLALAIYLLLALGPQLIIAGTPTIPLPYRFIADSFIVQTIRFPDRFNVLLALPFGLLVALGSKTILAKRPYHQHPLVITALISLLLLSEYLNQYETLSLAVPDWYATLAEQEGTFAILDIPSIGEEQLNKQYMYYQLIHGRPTVNGRIARVPDVALSYVEDVPLLENLLESDIPAADVPNVTFQIKLLAAENVRYIVLHRKFLSAIEEAAWLDWFVRPPDYQDDEVIVFDTAPIEVGQDVAIADSAEVPPSYGKFGLNTSISVDPAVVEQGSWLKMEAVWVVSEPIGADLTACFRLSHLQTAYQMESCQPLSALWPTSNWQEDGVIHAAYQMQIEPFAPPGDYEIFLHLLNEERLVTEQPFYLGTVSVQALDRQFLATQPQHEQTAVWQNIIQLNGYDLNQTPENLNLSLHWQALTRPDKSYKFFIHLLDGSSGQLAAQADFVPRDWTYPTNWWEAGEIVVDTAVLPLESVGNGTYQLLVGIYDPDTGERLLATTPDSAPVDALLLAEINR